MIDVNILDESAVVTVEGHPSVTVPLEPAPAQKVAPGYTRLGWIWSAVNNTFEAANIILPFEDSRGIASQISLKLASVSMYITATPLPVTCEAKP